MPKDMDSINFSVANLEAGVYILKANFKEKHPLTKQIILRK
jgi:hypothetical protein